MEQGLPEIHPHKEFMTIFDKNKIKYKSWGSSGPDFFLEVYDCIGELKKTDLKSGYDLAIEELLARKGKFDVSKYNGMFVIMK